MQENETEEILVIVQSNALVNPNTMMVKLLHAKAAHGAMLRPSWFLDLASAALDSFLKDYTIKFKSLERRNDCASVRIFIQLAWVHPARHKIARVADYHDQSAHGNVIEIQSLVRNVREAVPHKDIEATKRAGEVDDLDKGVVLVADVMGSPVDKPYKLFSTYFACYGFERVRQGLPEEYFHLCKTPGPTLIHTDEQV